MARKESRPVAERRPDPSVGKEAVRLKAALGIIDTGLATAVQIYCNSETYGIFQGALAKPITDDVQTIGEVYIDETVPNGLVRFGQLEAVSRKPAK